MALDDAERLFPSERGIRSRYAAAPSILSGNGGEAVSLLKGFVGGGREAVRLRRTISLCPYGASLSVTGSELDEHGTAF